MVTNTNITFLILCAVTTITNTIIITTTITITITTTITTSTTNTIATTMTDVKEEDEMRVEETMMDEDAEEMITTSETHAAKWARPRLESFRASERTIAFQVFWFAVYCIGVSVLSRDIRVLLCCIYSVL